MRRPRQQPRNRARWIIAACIVVLACVAGVAFAWTSGSNNPNNEVTAATLGSAGALSASTGDGCVTINLSWSAATNATSYLVEIKTLNGSYTTVIASTGNVTSYIDTTNRSASNATFTYRVTPIVPGSGWTGPVSTSGEIICGIGEVDDLASTNGCTASPVTLTWSAAGGTATMYDIWRSINGAGFVSAATNIAALTWNDTTRTAGQSVRYYVVPNNAGGTNGQNSNTTTAVTVGFVITGIAFTNTGTANSVNPGDQVAVTFSKASNGLTPAGTNSTSIFIQATTGSRGVYFASALAATASTAIARKAFGANITGTSQAFTGSAAWDGTNTVWTWTRGVGASVAESAPTWGAITVGTSGANPSRVRCNNGATFLSVSTVTPTGWF